ncbi:MAG: glycosyltransferase family 2 protein [Mariprofundales bacterium]
MKEKQPPISIIMPIYNGMSTLDLSLPSLMSQQDANLGSDYEIIVVDDGSTDGSADHISTHYPQIHLVRHQKNRGRIEARLSGIHAARFDRILLIDVRVIASLDLLTTYWHLDAPAPCMATVNTKQPNQTPLERVFECLRSTYYHADPLPSTEPCIVINNENFIRTRKGTTAIFLNRRTFLDSLPNRRDRLVNDDTRLFARMIEKEPLYRDLRLKITYLQRISFTEELPHLFERGILFADYYLHPKGTYRQHAILACALALLVVGLLIIYPKWTIISLISAELCVCRWLTLRPMDFLWLMLYLPIILPIFTMGALTGMIITANKSDIKP